MDSIAGISYYLNKCRCYYRVVYNNFVIQQDSAPVHLALDTVQLLQCKTLNFLSPELWPRNSPMLNRVASNKTGNATVQHLRESVLFCLSSFGM